MTSLKLTHPIATTSIFAALLLPGVGGCDLYEPEPAGQEAIDVTEASLASCVDATGNGVLASGGREIRLEHLPEAIRAHRPAGPSLRPEDRALRERLVELLGAQRGNVTAVGRDLGKAPMQIRRWCRRYGIEIATFRDRAHN